MRLTFLGGADEVGASSTLVEIAGKRLLIDAGIRISPRSNRGIQNSQLPDLRAVSEAGGVDYILATHAHTDHTGALPLVVEQYPVPVIATAPTFALVRTLQADAQRIMQSRQEQEGELPLFDEIAVQRLMDLFQPVEFNKPVRLGEGLQASYHPAGHILGAAMVILESEEGVLAFSGDLSQSAQRAVVAPPVPRLKVDAFVMESTYGGKLHANRVAEEKRLVEMLQAVVERGGKALVPAFAIGRAQEIIQIILAFRDQVSAPVYVDGMIRSVCNTYSAFREWLPAATVEAAGEDALFFRNKINRIRSAREREEVARADGPAIIVASSGMLTGGASVAYARALAGDARNAILLTGYQDEESPGRFLQGILRRRQKGEAVTLNLDGTKVAVECDIDTYSLSAHADESEMVNLAEALEADDVLLVHGDPGARHSIGARLRERGRRVRSPEIGQVYDLVYAARLVAVGKIERGSRAEPFDPRALWEGLKTRAGDYFSAHELARMWWGDGERAGEAVTALVGDGVYFGPDWRRKDNFIVRSPEQVERAQRCRAIMAAHPGLVGQVVVLRDSNNRPRVGAVLDAGADGFDAVVRNAKGRQYPGDALLWAVGRYPGNIARQEKIKGGLNHLFHAAEEALPALISFDRREVLAAAGKPVDPAALLPEALPEGVTPQAALLAVVWALAGDGATLELDERGLLPRRVLREGAMEMNQAREVAAATFPEGLRLRKVGMEVHRKRMVLHFDFPAPVKKKYRELMKQIEDQTGWEVVLNPTVNQQALGEAIDELLPPGVWITKGPSYFMDTGKVQVTLDGVVEVKALVDDYHEMTGFHLIVAGQEGAIPGGVIMEPVAKPSEERERMEINAAYGVIKLALGPAGLYKTSFKQGQIVLSFISPQVGERHRASIERLAQQTGYPLAIHPHPNQQRLGQIVSRLAREAGWVVVKGPSMYVAQGQVGLELAEPPGAEALAKVGAQVEEMTGYRLVVEE